MLKHPNGPESTGGPLALEPIFGFEGRIPRHELPAGELPRDVAYEIIHDELMLDGNARLNVATFVTTWMEPQADRLTAECLDKNMIDKDEYPQTAEIESRCVHMLSRLWHAPDGDAATGCSTTGSSEAAMLGGLALKRRWQHKREAAGQPADRPNMVTGINVQVCWEKFANYWDIELRTVPMDGDRYHMTADEAVKLCDENTIGVVAVLGSTYDGSYEPVQEICAALDDYQARTGIDVPVHVDGASGAFVPPPDANALQQAGDGLILLSHRFRRSSSPPRSPQSASRSSVRARTATDAGSLPAVWLRLAARPPHPPAGGVQPFEIPLPSADSDPTHQGRHSRRRVWGPHPARA